MIQTANADHAAPKQIALLGSTGSIGTQTLDVVRRYPQYFKIEILTAGSNSELLINQVLEFKPNAVVIGEEKYNEVKNSLAHTDTKVFAGEDALCEAVAFDSIDIVVVALMGSIGLRPTLAALSNGKQVALANKETLVMGGDFVRKAIGKYGKPLTPIDSEHSAIFQCLQGESVNNIEKIILTGSGGPFRGCKAAEIANITPAQALAHPTWSMGQKISVDSATLMNKGLELIEACHLFGVGPDKVEVVIHPQSIIHSLVSFIDGSVKAQLAPPDMKGPILYALSYPDRFSVDVSVGERLNLAKLRQLTFEEPDRETFICLGLAEKAMRMGEGMPCVLNAANEIAVQAFLDFKIGFKDIGLTVLELMEKAEVSGEYKNVSTLESLLELDIKTRKYANEYIEIRRKSR